MNENQKTTLKGLSSGTAVLIEMTTLGFFLENVKLEKQRTSKPYPIIMRNLLSQGLKGYWSGILPWGVTLGFSKGFILGTSKKKFDNFYGQYFDKYYTNLLAGISAGGVQGAFMNPLTLARTRVNQNMINRIGKDKKLKTTLFEEIKISSKILNKEIKKDGMKLIFTGMPMMIFKRSLDWGSRFFLINMFRENLMRIKKKDKLNDFEKLYTAYISGIVSVSFAQPFDRIMPLLQQKYKNNRGLIYNISSKIKKEGFITMYRGWGVRSIMTGWHTMFAVFISEKIFNSMENKYNQYYEFNDI